MRGSINMLVLRLSSFGLMAATLAVTVPKAQAAEPLEQWELQDFDHFLNHHPGVRVDLFHDPFLARDPAWRANHRDFDKYLAKHPGIREQFEMNPGRCVAREREYENWGCRR